MIKPVGLSENGNISERIERAKASYLEENSSVMEN